jgi:FdhE protein
MSGSGIVPIEEIGSVQPPAFVRLPELATIFTRRAERFAKLAPGHVLEGWLRFMADVSRAQATALGTLPPARLPGRDELDAARDAARPALEALHWRDDPTWSAALDAVLAAMASVAKPELAERARTDLAACDMAARIGLVERILALDLAPAERAYAPYLAAALQLYWTRMAALLAPDDVGRPEHAALCPVCGSPPVASVVSGSGSDARPLRYVCCGLCQSQWNEVRIKCTACASTKGISYSHIEGGSDTVKAETCDECKTYLKILYREKDVTADPIADDLASLQLDIMVSEAGYHRVAPNPFLILGEDS